MREATVCIPVRGDPPTEILLGLKKAGFAAGKINGIGGKVEPGETVVAAAVRELAEEAGLKAAEQDLRHVGLLTFLFPARPGWSQRVYVFLTSTWRGEPEESREMAPAWFSVDDIPYQRMWQDNVHWLPRILAGERVRARFTYTEDNETVETLVAEPWDSMAD